MNFHYFPRTYSFIPSLQHYDYVSCSVAFKVPLLSIYICRDLQLLHVFAAYYYSVIGGKMFNLLHIIVKILAGKALSFPACVR
jgi:hypothetical protein